MSEFVRKVTITMSAQTSFVAQDSFVQELVARARACPREVFARFNDATIDFETINRKSDAVAAALHGLGLARGDRVAVMMRNSPETLAVLFGLAKFGAIWIPVNVRLKGEGLRYILNHCAPSLCICDDDLLATVRESKADLERTRFVIAGGKNRELENLIAQDRPFSEPLPKEDHPFAIMYTSGTSGPPKGVIVSHQMLRLAGEGVKKVSAARAGDVFFTWEPLYHIGGAQMLVLPLICNVTLAMVDRFSASRFWSEVRHYKATHLHYLGGILQMLLKQPPDPMDREHTVRIAWGGGCPKEIWQSFEQRFGVEIRECYGMTEASSITTCNDNGVVGAVGKPMPWFTVEILDEKDKPVAAGSAGEIVVRTSIPGAIFEGYFRNPEATERTLRNGALYTGDLGILDRDGNLWFHGRKSDSVRCKGENVSAWEVETVAIAHPAVEDCAMIGVATDVGEQDIKLFIKPKLNATIDFPEISAWLSERLAPYQNPRYFEVVEEFDRTPSQRIMKHRLSRSTADCWDRLAAAKGAASKGAVSKSTVSLGARKA